MRFVASTGSFSARYDDGSFVVSGSMDSAQAVEGAPGHLGFERNGVFLTRERE